MDLRLSTSTKLHGCLHQVIGLWAVLFFFYWRDASLYRNNTEEARLNEHNGPLSIPTRGASMPTTASRTDSSLSSSSTTMRCLQERITLPDTFTANWLRWSISKFAESAADFSTREVKDFSARSKCDVKIHQKYQCRSSLWTNKIETFFGIF